MQILTSRLFRVTEVFGQVFFWRCARYAFEYTVEIGDAIKPAVVRHRGDAIEFARGKPFTRLVDAHFVEEGHECNARVLLEIPAKSLRRKLCFCGDLLHGKGMLVAL